MFGADAAQEPPAFVRAVSLKQQKARERHDTLCPFSIPFEFKWEGVLYCTFRRFM